MGSDKPITENEFEKKIKDNVKKYGWQFKSKELKDVWIL